MQSYPSPSLPSELAERRRRLASAVERSTEPQTELLALLAQVDGALERLQSGTYGICACCHGEVEVERLASDPLLTLCLACLSRDERRALERDLETASRVQEALLPRHNLQIGGWHAHFRYLPAGPVSGDYVDIVESGSAATAFHFVFGDVSGKGVSASLLMSHLKAVFRTLLVVERPLTDIVAQANRLFCESTLSQHYATLVCGRAHHDGRIEVVNAGHPAPMLLTDGGQHCLAASGLPLGLFCAAPYRAEVVQLAPDESLLLYTDGVSEATDGSGREYGSERLGKVAEAWRQAPPRDLVAACLADLVRFREGTPAGDDTSLMVLRRGVFDVELK